MWFDSQALAEVTKGGISPGWVPRAAAKGTAERAAAMTSKPEIVMRPVRIMERLVNDFKHIEILRDISLTCQVNHA